VTVPSFNVNQILELRDRLVTRVFYPRLGQTVEGLLVDELVVALAKELPDGIIADVLYETVRQLVPLHLNAELATIWAWRIAGNLPQLKQRQSVRTWTRQHRDEWVPMQVLDVTAARNRYGNFGSLMTFQILAGSPCGMHVQKFWSRTVLFALAKRMGFSRTEGQRPFQHPVEYVNLRLLGMLEAARSEEAPFFHQVDCPSNFLTWNKDIQDRRVKIKHPCPRGWQHPCHLCAVGYDQCPAGTHPYTYVMQECNHCGTRAPFNPHQDYCIQCTEKERLKP